MIKLNNIQDVYIDELDIHVKPVILDEDVIYIGKQVMTRTDYMERKILKEMLILEKCTDIKNLDKQDYNVLKYNGVTDAVLKNIMNADDVDEYTKYGESMNMALNEFLKQLLVYIDKVVKKIPNNKKMEELLNKAYSIAKK